MIRTVLLALCCLAAPASAQVQMAALNPKAARMVGETIVVANRLFPGLPAVRLTSNITGTCGSGPASDLARYCTTSNLIFLAADIDERLSGPAAAYLIAHQLAHAAQERAGIARQATGPEARAALEVQADCIAGVILSRSFPDAEGRPSTWLPGEALTEPHYGPEPLGDSTALAIPAASRDEWFGWGREMGGAEHCNVGTLGAQPFAPR
ncbi:neutral zinc metallopeptidase [Halovulum sp. GXIMD14794]